MTSETVKARMQALLHIMVLALVASVAGSAAARPAHTIPECAKADTLEATGKKKEAKKYRAVCEKKLKAQGPQPVDQAACGRAQALVDRCDFSSAASREARQRCVQTGGKLKPAKGNCTTPKSQGGGSRQPPPRSTTSSPPPPVSPPPPRATRPVTAQGTPPQCSAARRELDAGRGSTPQTRALMQQCYRQGGVVPPPAQTPAPATASAPAPAPAPAPAASTPATGKAKKGWARELPSVKTVQMTMHGPNRLDTLARQQAAYVVLSDYIAARQRQTRKNPKRARHRTTEYLEERNKFVQSGAPGGTAYVEYARSMEFREQTLSRFISPKALEAYRKTPEYAQAKAADPASQRPADQKSAAR